uniref:Uncharacterized protein n=1 Tax=Fagus sylvatica TaxID=28930 RepID=A0A2N9ENI9_FAGSY
MVFSNHHRECCLGWCPSKRARDIALGQTERLVDAISNGFLSSWPSTTAICVRFGFVLLYLICNSSIEAFKHFLLECPPSGIEWCFSPWTIGFYLPNLLPLVDWAKLMLFLTSPLGCIFEDERHFSLLVAQGR